MISPYILFSIGAFMIAMTLAGIIVTKRGFNRLLQIKQSGLRTAANIIACEPYSVKGSKRLEVKYEFQTATGDMRKSTHESRDSSENREIYKIGNSIKVLYLPDDPQANTVEDGLDARIVSLNSFSRILPFTVIPPLLVLVCVYFLPKH